MADVRERLRRLAIVMKRGRTKFFEVKIARDAVILPGMFDSNEDLPAS